MFIQIEFGVVFFVLSCFYLIYVNMESGNDDKKGVSAYSVFNKDGEALLGSFNTNSMEKMFGLPDYKQE